MNAGAVHIWPIFLTAVTAMVGAAVILLGPIFQGLAITLVFDLATSTALTLLVIPAIYVVLRDDGLTARRRINGRGNIGANPRPLDVMSVATIGVAEALQRGGSSNSLIRRMISLSCLLNSLFRGLGNLPVAG